MYCTNCGQKMEDDARFCTNCGEPIVVEGATAPLPEAIAEPSQAQDGANSQPVASKSAGSASTVEVEPKETNSSKDANGSSGSKDSGKMMIAGISIGVAACAIVVLIVLFATGIIGGSSPEPEESTTTVEEVEATEEEVQEDAQAAEEQEVEEPETHSSASASSSVPAAPANFTYTNSRFGYSVVLPSSFEEVTSGQGNNGVVFFDEDIQMEIQMAGFNRIYAVTMTELYEEQMRKHDVSYSHLGDDFFVVSYLEDGYIYYVKDFCGSASENQITFQYPANYSDVGNPLVEQIVPTFTPGNLNVEHNL